MVSLFSLPFLKTMVFSHLLNSSSEEKTLIFVSLTIRNFIPSQLFWIITTGYFFASLNFLLFGSPCYSVYSPLTCSTCLPWIPLLSKLSHLQYHKKLRIFFNMFFEKFIKNFYFLILFLFFWTRFQWIFFFLLYTSKIFLIKERQ